MENTKQIARVFCFQLQDWINLNNLSKSTVRLFTQKDNQCRLKEFKKVSEVAEKVLGKREK